MAQHVKILGIVHIVMAALGLLAGIVVFLVLGGVAGFVGSVAGDNDAAVAVPILIGIGTFVGILLAVLAIPGLIAGWGLMNFRPWARVLTLVLAALHLFNIPFGTALSIYSFWVLLSAEGSRLFDSRASGPMPYTGAPLR